MYRQKPEMCMRPFPQLKQRHTMTEASAPILYIARSQSSTTDSFNLYQFSFAATPPLT